MRLRPALVAPLAVLTVGLAGCGDPTPVATDPTSSPSSPDPSESPDSPSPSSSDSPSDGASSEGSSTVPVYFVGDTERGGPRLYREFRRVDGDPLVAAAALLTSGDTSDPDYYTLFPGGGFADVSASDGEIVVTVADDGWNTPAPGMSRSEARLAIQQLVYTLQGVQQERAPVVVRSQDGAPVPLFGFDELRQAPPLQVLSLVNLTSPEQGAVVSDGTLEVSGVGNSFEASVGWEVRRGDRKVLDGYATMDGWMEPKLFPFEVAVDVSDLDPGEYTFWVTTDDPTGGTEGVGAMTDDREFTIE